MERRRGSKDNQTENKGGLSRELPVKKIKKRSKRKFDNVCLLYMTNTSINRTITNVYI